MEQSTPRPAPCECVLNQNPPASTTPAGQVPATDQLCQLRAQPRSHQCLVKSTNQENVKKGPKAALCTGHSRRGPCRHQSHTAIHPKHLIYKHADGTIHCPMKTRKLFTTRQMEIVLHFIKAMGETLLMNRTQGWSAARHKARAPQGVCRA